MNYIKGEHLMEKTKINKKKRISFFAFLLYFIVVFILIGKFVCPQDYIIDDYSFTNQEYTKQQYMKFYDYYPNNKLTDEQKRFAYYYCRYYQIHPLIFWAKLEYESSLTSNPTNLGRYKWRLHRCLGYGRIYWKTIKGKRYHLYDGYWMQTYFAIRTLRKHFDLWKPGKKIYVKDLKTNCTPQNAATYSIMIYNPFWGKHYIYGPEKPTWGNELFIPLYKKFKRTWMKIIKEKK